MNDERADPGPIIGLMWKKLEGYLAEGGKARSEEELSSIWLGFITALTMMSGVMKKAGGSRDLAKCADIVYRECEQVTLMMGLDFDPELN